MTMTTPLVALVTAGSAGTGEAAARRFAQEGMRVVVNYANNAERAENVIKDLTTLSPLEAGGQTNFCAIRADMGNHAEIIRLVDETVSTMGRLDVVFSNAGWTHFRNFSNLDDNMVEDDWDRCFNMNVKSHLFLMHAAKEHLDKTQGSFITTASLAGVVAGGSSLAYSVTKAAQIHLVRGLAVSAGPNIRVNTVSPGLMLTEWGKKFSEEHQNAIKDKTKLKRHITVDDVAEQVMCFVRSKGMTGTNAVIDAGLSV